MFKNWSITKKLIAGFGVIFLIVGLVSLYTLYSLYVVKKDVEDLGERADKIKFAAKIRKEIMENVIGNVSLMLLTNEPEKRKEYYNEILKAREEYRKTIEVLKSNTRSEEGKKLLKGVEDVIIIARDINNKVIELALTGKTAEAIFLYEKDLTPKLKVIGTEVDKLISFYAKTADERGHEALNCIKRLFVILFVFGGIFIVISLVVVFGVTTSIRGSIERLRQALARVREGDLAVEIAVDSRDEIGLMSADLREALVSLRNLIEEVKHVSVALAGSSEELSAITKQFSASIENQTQKATQIASAAEQMSITVVDIAKNTTNILEESKKTAEIAREGENYTLKTANEVKVIERTADKLKEVMQTLEERTKAIESVVEFIKDVAEQTNLLALNATIEAARAGEHGKSFAVVAGEIRKLAERTNKSTDEIAGVIREIKGVVEEVSREVEEIGAKVESG
ncbi:methyl-accepting chemotaxis protein, partial [Thermodesulfobacterium thermophilum]|uniref:methyl-accepting chemotaxis protein n=1 Tax=Thermodesulfobacterium thermophilum TaxID=886 RepID=UPI0003B3A7D6